ncbi:hypothetical protein [Streptomyces sp. NPDC001450]
MSPTSLEREFLWTALPAGRVGSVPGLSEPMALISVLLTPRLKAPGTAPLTVRDFGMQSWPDRLGRLRFDVFRAGRLLTSHQVPYLDPEGRTIHFSVADQLSAWRALLDDATPVQPYQPTAYDGHDVRTFPAAEAAGEIRSVYTATGRAYLAHEGLSARNRADLLEALRGIDDVWRSGLPPSADGASGQSALARAYAFYRRDFAGHASAPQPAAAPSPQPDFHETVARLADHPLLLRALALLVDLAVPASELAQAGDTDLCVVPRWPVPDTQAPPNWTNAVQHDLSPRTAYTLTGKRFVPASLPGPASTGFDNGMLPLAGTGQAPSHNPRYELMPFDVDGAALRLVGAASSPGALPPLRTKGIALVERDREAQHTRQLQRAQQRSTTDGLLGTPLGADSLLGGYRLDVQDVATGRWFSLGRRRVRYRIGALEIGHDSSGGLASGLLDEGWVRPAPVTMGTSADALYLHQAVLRWDGWSTVVPRPERVVDTGDGAQVAPKAAPLEVVVACDPGSLPRLRFGDDYRLRVRLVDLAGGGLRSDEVRPGEEQTERFTHQRYEPLLPPEIVPTSEFADGERQDRMVIRSDRGVSAHDYAAAHGCLDHDLRRVLAAKCSLELALQHEGLFDSALGPDAPASELNRLFEIAERADRDVRDARGAVVFEGVGRSGRGAPYVALTEEDVTLPWLADPAGTHIELNVADRPIDPHTGSPGSVDGLPENGIGLWQGQWPDLGPMTLRLVEATAGCTVSVSDDYGTLTVALGPAEQVTFDIPSCPKDVDVQLFGITRWLGINAQDLGDPGVQHIARGLNPLVTPPRQVTLVHAVQRPLSDPGGRLTPQRQAGGTDVDLTTGSLGIDVASTGRIDVDATWTDKDDVLDHPEPQKHTAHVGSFDVPHKPLLAGLPRIRQEIGDTRHHLITYSVTAVSRFQDCFPPALADSGGCLAHGTLDPTDIPSTVRPPAPHLQYAIPTFAWSQTTGGAQSVIRSRRGGGLRVFLDQPWFATGDDEALVVLAWPSPPAPDDVLPYVSVAGRDPVWSTGAPPALLTHGQITAPTVVQVDLPEARRTLEAMAYPVQPDAEGKRWYADIDLSAVVSSSYFPFVRLALARYQRHTMPGVPCVSPPVRTEPIQLPPHRRLTVSRTAGHAAVVVDGLGPGGSAPNVIRTELQAQDPASGSTGWVTVFRTSAALGQSHTVDIPSSGGRPLRVVTKEYETRPSAGSAATGEDAGRLVFADVIPL